MTFRGTALLVQSVTDREWILSGPADTGKSYATLWRLDQLLAETPRAQGVLVRKVLSDIAPSVLVTYLRVIAISKSGAVAYGGGHPEWFDYPNGARLWIAGMDRPGKVLSSERDFIYVNQAEELALADWETLKTRVTGRGAVTSTPMLFGDCNPGSSKHWILDRERRGVLKRFNSRHEDNPDLYDDMGNITEEGVKRIADLDTLTGMRYKRLRKGLWASAEGVVYETYDPAIHVWSWEEFERRYNTRTVPKDWPRVRVIDFGLRNPFVCQWWCRDPDGNWIRYREIYMTGRTVTEHAKTIARVERWYGDDEIQFDERTGRLTTPTNPERERFAATICDHDAEDRQTLRDNGIDNIAAIKDVARGIQAVTTMLGKPATADEAAVAPQLYYMRDALVERDESLVEAARPTETTEEFEVYVWEKDASGKSMKEVPVKEHDHGMDTTRYLAMYVMTQGSSRPRIGTVNLRRSRVRDDDDY